jgi:hypothetical protein
MFILLEATAAAHPVEVIWSCAVGTLRSCGARQRVALSSTNIALLWSAAPWLAVL